LQKPLFFRIEDYPFEMFSQDEHYARLCAKEVHEFPISEMERLEFWDGVKRRQDA